MVRSVCDLPVMVVARKWRVLVNHAAAKWNTLCRSGVFNIDRREGKNATQASMSFPKNNRNAER